MLRTAASRTISECPWPPGAAEERKTPLAMATAYTLTTTLKAGRWPRWGGRGASGSYMCMGKKAGFEGQAHQEEGGYYPGIMGATGQRL